MRPLQFFSLLGTKIQKPHTKINHTKNDIKTKQNKQTNKKTQQNTRKKNNQQPCTICRRFKRRKLLKIHGTRA